MGEYMKRKINNIFSIILPNKKINIFIITIIILGVTSGSIFASVLNVNDKNLVLEKLKLFLESINSNSINNLNILKNSLSINLIYSVLIFLFGMTIIGLFIIIFLLFIKSFILGFTIASFIISYSTKGIIISFIYLLFGELLNIFSVLFITVYSISFTIKLLKLIFKNNMNNKEILTYFKKYLLAFGITIIINTISSISEAFILPSLIKLIIKIYV